MSFRSDQSSNPGHGWNKRMTAYKQGTINCDFHRIIYSNKFDIIKTLCILFFEFQVSASVSDLAYLGY